MKVLIPYIASMIGFATAMSLHAAGETDSRISRGKTRAIFTAPLWPLYAVTASIALSRGTRGKTNSTTNT